MPRSISVLVPLVLLSIASCCDHDPASPEPEPEYPTTLHPLSEEALNELRADYAALNPRVCSTLNEYGLTSGLCYEGTVGLPESTDVGNVIARAKVVVTANAQFTGVSDASNLHVRSYLISPQRRFLRIVFEPQCYAGLEVVGSTVSVHMDSLGALAINGCHYRQIYIPDPPLVSAAQAQAAIIGLQITWYDSDGNSQIYAVTGDSFQGEPARVVLPHELETSIQLRVAWQIPVGTDILSWFVYVDTMDGQLLKVEQLFYT